MELLLRHESRQEAKNAALEHALMYGRLPIAELVLSHGADVSSVPFLDVLMTGDRSLAASFLAKEPIRLPAIRSRTPSTNSASRALSVLTLIAGACGLNSRPSCRSRPTWRSDSSARRGISSG